MSTTDDALPPELRPQHPLTGLGYRQPVQQRRFTALGGSGRSEGSAPIVEEVPVAMVYNSQPHAVMMATPADFEDFAVGFSLSEGIVAAPRDIRKLDVLRYAQGIEVQMTIPDAAMEQLKERGRALIGRVGCGLCGVQTIEEALRQPPPVAPGGKVRMEALWRAERELPGRQELNRETASLHAAAWANDDGLPMIVREDVGRHNALDKVIGALARTGRNPAEGFVVITSRASYELVQKSAAVGIRLLAAVSRPTGLAIALAEASGVTLVALLRGNSANVYAHGERLQ